MKNRLLLHYTVLFISMKRKSILWSIVFIGKVQLEYLNFPNIDFLVTDMSIVVIQKRINLRSKCIIILWSIRSKIIAILYCIQHIYQKWIKRRLIRCSSYILMYLHALTVFFQSNVLRVFVIIGLFLDSFNLNIRFFVMLTSWNKNELICNANILKFYGESVRK